MDRKKLIIYGVAIAISVIISLIMLLSPEPGGKKPDITRAPRINVKSLDDLINSGKPETSEMDTEEEVAESNYTFEGITVARNIFRSQLLATQEKVESIKQAEQKAREVRKPDFKILGTIIVGDDRSIILNTSEILNEGAIKDGFFIMRILSNRVVLRAETGEIFEINIWEEN